MVVLFLVFEGSSILFSVAATPINIPTNSVGGFPFLHTLSSIYFNLYAVLPLGWLSKACGRKQDV